MSKIQLQSSNRMTEGNPYKLIVSFAVPILLGNIFQQLYSVVDLAIVSRTLGLDALASVGTTYTISGLLYSFVNGLTNGFSLITAQFYGAGDSKEVRRSIAATVSIALALTVLFTILSLLLIRPLFHFLNTPQSLISDAYDYISVLLWGLVFTMLYNMLANILKAVGNSFMPLVFLVIAALLNIGLDILFVNGLGLGIRGASGATVLAQAVSALLCLIYIIKKCPELHITRADFHFDRQLISKLLTTGLSMSMMLSIVNVGSIILQSGINGLGETTLAAHTAARKLLEISMMPISVFGAATATYSGQNYGAGKIARVKKGTKAAMVLCTGWCLLSALILIPFAPSLVSFLADDSSEEILSLGSRYLRIGTPFFLPLSVLIVLRNMLQGIGHRAVPILCSTLEMLSKVAAINLLVPPLGYLGVCLTEPIIWVLCAVVILIYYLVQRRKWA